MAKKARENGMGPEPYKRDKRSPIPKNAATSKIMSRIKGENTKPEIAVRKMLFANGLQGYRVNYKRLPGKPDIVYIKKKVAIFVNGCYWHGCNICVWKLPKHNPEYWANKIEKTQLRDKVKKETLEYLGYTVLVVWEHEIKQDLSAVLKKIRDKVHQV